MADSFHSGLSIVRFPSLGIKLRLILVLAVGAYIYQTVATYLEYSKQEKRWKSLGGYELQDAFVKPNMEAQSKAKKLKHLSLQLPDLMTPDSAILAQPYDNTELSRLVTMHSHFYTEMDKMLEGEVCNLSSDDPSDVMSEFKELKGTRMHSLFRARLVENLAVKDNETIVYQFNQLIKITDCWDSPSFPNYRFIKHSYVTRYLKDVIQICRNQSDSCELLSLQVSRQPPCPNYLRSSLLERGASDLHFMKEHLPMSGGHDDNEQYSFIIEVLYHGPTGYFWRARDQALFLERMSNILDKNNSNYLGLLYNLGIERDHMPWWSLVAQVALPKPNNIPPDIFMPETIRRIIKSAADIREFRKSNSALPEAPDLPDETLTGNPLHYRVVGSGFMLWSDYEFPDQENAHYYPLYLETEVPGDVLRFQEERKLVTYFN